MEELIHLENGTTLRLTSKDKPDIFKVESWRDEVCEPMRKDNDDNK